MTWSGVGVFVGRASMGLAIIAMWLAVGGGCQPYRIEHHKRPQFYQQAAGGALPDEITMPDGTVIVYEEIGHEPPSRRKRQPEKPFLAREELPDGTVILRARNPEHVLANTLMCIRNAEYKLIYEQLLAEETRQNYAAVGQGIDEFTAFFIKNRKELARTLNRMLAGMQHNETQLLASGKYTRARLRSHVADGFKFRNVDMVREADGLKLLLIR